MEALEFLKASLFVQVALGSGYAAYMIGYSGLRRNMTQVDKVFAIIAFSAIATLLQFAMVRGSVLAGSISACVLTVATGIAWRRFGRSRLYNFLHRWDVSWSDENTSALSTMLENTDFYVSQIAVLTDDGTWLRCDNTTPFYQNSPFKAGILSDSGDVALYLTHEDRTGEPSEEQKFTTDSYYGDLITYVPASRIRRITMRHKVKANRSAKEAEVAE